MIQKLLEAKKIPVKKVAARLLTDSKGKNAQFWSKEISLLKRLINKYPNGDFWEKEYIRPVPSFAVWLVGGGAEFIAKRYQEFLSERGVKEEIIISNEKSGEDFVSTKKPRSIRQFLS